MQCIWMKVTKDEYQLPLVIADSAQELADICHVKPHNIFSAVWHSKRDGRISQYIKVEVED